ncbi:MAG TPA: type II toxin-antitoxin system VapC family toxin [Conexibacter sp.]|nr:type II toxin-antitoxin system VapC family toxin [Conexibacter sp.]
MIVLDASVALDVLLGAPTAEHAMHRLADEREPLAAPDALLVEVARVLRRHAIAGRISQRLGTELLDDLLALDVECYPTELLVQRAWTLRDNFTLDDALYVTLAELTDATLLTTDAKLAASARRLVGIDVLVPEPA